MNTYMRVMARQPYAVHKHVLPVACPKAAHGANHLYMQGRMLKSLQEGKIYGRSWGADRDHGVGWNDMPGLGQ